MATPEARGTLSIHRGTVTRTVATAWIAPPGAVAMLAVGHGAGAGMDHPFVVGFCRAMAESGVATFRFNFQYLEAGRRSPDPEAVLRETWLAAFQAASTKAGGPVLAGGKSLGGRIASLCVADGMPAAGLVFLGYPLHAPGRLDRVRDEHLYRIEAPMLFLHGTEDPFARPELLKKVLERLGDLAEYAPVPGGDHSFNVKGTRRDAREVGASLAAVAAPFVHRVAGGR